MFIAACIIGALAALAVIHPVRRFYCATARLMLRGILAYGREVSRLRWGYLTDDDYLYARWLASHAPDEGTRH